jgi:hypothetical protein
MASSCRDSTLDAVPPWISATISGVGLLSFLIGAPTSSVFRRYLRNICAQATVALRFTFSRTLGTRKTVAPEPSQQYERVALNIYQDARTLEDHPVVCTLIPVFHASITMIFVAPLQLCYAQTMILLLAAPALLFLQGLLVAVMRVQLHRAIFAEVGAINVHERGTAVSAYQVSLPHAAVLYTPWSSLPIP